MTVLWRPPRKIMSFVTCTEDDFRILIAKGFVIPFESGVCVIRDWKGGKQWQKEGCLQNPL